jgi:dTDP-4-dehydrorhamnose reductase
MRINAIAPGILAEEAKRLGALLVHYSTDYIFDGSKAAPYTEDDLPAPINVYGNTKLEGERAIRASSDRHIIVRTSWVYGPRGKNFYMTMKAKGKLRQPVQVVSDQTGVPTTSRFLAAETIALVGGRCNGVVNLVPTGATTWYGFASEIFELEGLDLLVRPVATADYPSPARRPLYSVLDNSKAAALLQKEFPTWRELLASVSPVPGP